MEYQKDKKEIKKFETTINEFCSFYITYFTNNNFSLSSFCSFATNDNEKEIISNCLEIIKNCNIDLKEVKNCINDNIEKIIKLQFELYQNDKVQIKNNKI